MSNELVLMKPAELVEASKNVAHLCKDIVKKTVITIGRGKKAKDYVKVEGWQAIANAFGCTAGARDVAKVYDEADDRLIGYKATGEVRRNSDGVVISTGEGFVGTDEVQWFGGIGEVWNEDTRKMMKKPYAARHEYAIRAMAQTRGISRACRSAFAFVIVLIDEKLSTVPAEEAEGFAHEDGARERTMEAPSEKQATVTADGKDWKSVICVYGKKDGPLRNKALGELTDLNLKFLYGRYCDEGAPEPQAGDKAMVEGLKLWNELENTEKKW